MSDGREAEEGFGVFFLSLWRGRGGVLLLFWGVFLKIKIVGSVMKEAE